MKRFWNYGKCAAVSEKMHEFMERQEESTSDYLRILVVLDMIEKGVNCEEELVRLGLKKPKGESE